MGRSLLLSGMLLIISIVAGGRCGPLAKWHRQHRDAVPQRICRETLFLNTRNARCFPRTHWMRMVTTTAVAITRARGCRRLEDGGKMLVVVISLGSERHHGHSQLIL